jgi:dihydrofolate synthase/folylpolyglutamate synthase
LTLYKPADITQYVATEKGSEEFLAWLYGLSRHGIKLGLENTKELLRRLGNPQEHFRSVHVAGTDGKGSVCAMINFILTTSGVRTGLYTSPHILKFNERISVCGVPISDAELSRLAERIVPQVNEMADSGMLCTFFEATTAIAFLYFKEKGVEYAVAEVGMGGRFDATNVILPDVTVINGISMEHTEYLGDTIEKIAFEKAGIIKPGVPCITANTGPAYSVIKEVAEEKRAPLIGINPDDIEVTGITDTHTNFSYGGETYGVSVPGRHQAKNAVLAMEAVSRLPVYPECDIRKGLESVYWPCRMQRIQGTPFIVDVTHTSAGAKDLCTDCKDIYGRVTAVLGILSDKDADGISESICGIAERVIIASPKTPRAASLRKVRDALLKYGADVTEKDSVAEAMEEAIKVHGDEPILVTGSFYTAEEAVRWLKKTYPGCWTYSPKSM